MKQRNSTIDLAKFILACFVVAIHVRPFSGDLAFIYDDIIARLANPLFFMITAYFFFTKIHADVKSSDNRNHRQHLSKYIFRIIRLYFIWVIIFFPMIIKQAKVVARALGQNEILCLIQNIFLRGPYGAMWFLTALNIAILLTFLFVKKFSPIVSLICSAPFYIIGVCMTEYGNIFSSIGFFRAFDIFISKVFSWYANGLTFGWFFCSLGAYIALVKTKEKNHTSKQKEVIMLVICLILLLAEAYLVRNYNLGTGFGASIMMVPTSIIIMKLLLRDPIDFSETGKKICQFLQRCSVLIFLLHYPIMEGVEKMGRIDSSLEYLLVLVISLCMSSVIVALSQIKSLGFLKYLY